MEPGDEQLFEYVWIRLNEFPNFTTDLNLEEFINSITIGSPIHPTILLPHPKSCHLVRSETDITAHAMLKFDWTLGRTEEEADARLTEILDACDRLKLARLSLPKAVPTPKIEPVLVCPTELIHLPDPDVSTSDLSEPLVSFAPYIKVPSKDNKRRKNSYSSKGFKPSVDDHRYDSPSDYSNQAKLNNMEFVRRRHENARENRETYLAADKLRRIRSMPWAERLKH